MIWVTKQGACGRIIVHDLFEVIGYLQVVSCFSSKKNVLNNCYFSATSAFNTGKVKVLNNVALVFN